KAGEGCAYGKGIELDCRGVDAQRTAGHLILAQCFPGPAHRHAQQAVDDEQGEEHQHQRQEVQEHDPVHRIEVDAEELVEGLGTFAGTPAEFQSEQVRLGDVADAVGAIGQAGEVVQQDADDLAKAQGHYRQIVAAQDRKSTRLNSSHVKISYAVFCLKKK